MLVYSMQCTYILRRITTDARQNYAKGSSKEEGGRGIVGNPVYVFVSLLYWQPGPYTCTPRGHRIHSELAAR